MNSFGERIKWLRETREMNQTELANQLHMTQRKVSYLERGTYEPSLSDIVAFCRFFQVSADFLLGLAPDGLPLPPK